MKTGMLTFTYGGTPLGEVCVQDPEGTRASLEKIAEMGRKFTEIRKAQGKPPVEEELRQLLAQLEGQK